MLSRILTVYDQLCSSLEMTLKFKSKFKVEVKAQNFKEKTLVT